jgi:hypothetical protein
VGYEVSVAQEQGRALLAAVEEAHKDLQAPAELPRARPGE